MYDTISCILDQESFALDGSMLNSTVNVSGTIQIHSESLCFIPPAWTQIQLIGREQIGSDCQIIVNDTFLLSNYLNEWQPSPSFSSSNDSTAAFDYILPFSLPVPSNMPISFQIYDQQQDFVCCRIYYTLEIKFSSMIQSISQPIHFHRSNTIQRKSISSIKRREEDENVEPIPKKVFWGITKQSKQRWQYELEFPNAFDSATFKSGCISLRLRSVYGNMKEMKNECCLIGCQIIQSIHVEGYQTYFQVIATSTKLLTNPSKSWLNPCQVDFDLEGPALPTVDNQRFGVEHFIRISVEFCSGCEGDEADRCSLDLQFPLVFTGCALTEQFSIDKSSNKHVLTDQTSSSSSYTSFSQTIKSDDSAIDIPPSYKSI